MLTRTLATAGMMVAVVLMILSFAEQKSMASAAFEDQMQTEAGEPAKAAECKCTCPKCKVECPHKKEGCTCPKCKGKCECPKHKDCKCPKKKCDCPDKDCPHHKH